LEPAVLLHTFPKMFVDVYCLAVQADGGELPVALMAASLALADAGIALRDLVPACTLVCPFIEFLILESALFFGFPPTLILQSAL
jgi:ribonuclease PH